MQHAIEFRSLKNLSQIIHSFSTDSLKPTALCTVYPFTLLFVHCSKLSHDVYWLDCSGDEPKLTGKKINIVLNYLDDICYIPDEKKPLLVAADYLLSSVQAYDVITSERNWTTQARGHSITAGGTDYLMVCSCDNGIRMLSPSDGKNLGYLKSEEDGELEMPCWMRWIAKTSSFLVAHEVNREYHISTIEGQKVYPDLSKSQSEENGAELDNSQSEKREGSLDGSQTQKSGSRFCLIS